ncbi:hypothetical protein [Kibdelosporangium philippinense]|uniref:hypothetical protein n=1 Tax=Kibdelosporangium philippinense TaxID=211113 RepID=UPI00360DA206
MPNQLGAPGFGEVLHPLPFRVEADAEPPSLLGANVQTRVARPARTPSLRLGSW